MVKTYLSELSDYTIIYAPGVRPAIEVGHAFAFVLNVSEVDREVVSLAEGHQLRKATSSEVVAIKDVLTNNAAVTDWGAWQNGPLITSGTKTTSEHLPESEWRYFVIAFDGSNSTIAEIEHSLCIAPFELKIAFTLMPEAFPTQKNPTLTYGPPRLFSQVRRMTLRILPTVKIAASEINAMVQLREQIRTHSNSTLNVQSFIRQILDLDGLPHESPLLFLGYFAILESLLTHKVKETDTLDSITRQVKQKVILLDNRWQPRIDYSPFHGTKPDRIWSRMYSYRSTLAHGSTPDFAKDLKELGDRDRSLSLLTQTVRNILRQALIEPQLILDLRNC
jgi:hypothetical protein